MPKPTFLNLPDEKRERFVAAALDEFARHPYDTASVSAIIARLGIAKGSVYQYFDGKRDLFQWLAFESFRRKKAAVTLQQVPPGSTFFDRLELQYRAGLDFWRADPLWARLGLRMFEPSKDEALDGFRRQLAQMAFDAMRVELAEAQREGTLRTDLDLDIATHLFLGTMQQGLLGAYLTKAGLDFTQLDDDPLRAAELPEAAILDVVRETIDFLRRGLGARDQGAAG